MGDIVCMNTMTIEQVAEAAKKIAAQNAFEYAGNYGRGTFRFEVLVDFRGDRVALWAKVNACISIERAREEMQKVWSALVAEIQESGSTGGFVMPKHRGRYVWRTGFWNMGTFCTDGISRQIKIRKAA